MAANQNTTVTKEKTPFNLGLFIKDTRNEIAKVTWPTRKETVMTTVAIVVMALIVGVFFFGIDTAIGYAVSHLLGMSS